MLLNSLDESGQGMTDQQIRDEIVTLFLAGHETTANALSWTWYLLAQHPEVEQKLHEELHGILHGRVPTLADLKQLPYTELVLEESMRLYPPVWNMSRQALTDVEVGGYIIPKGSEVNLNTYAMHHDPRWWDEPEHFNPHLNQNISIHIGNPALPRWHICRSAPDRASVLATALP